MATSTNHICPGCGRSLCNCAPSPGQTRVLHLVVFDRAGNEHAMDLARELSRHNNSLAAVLSCEACMYVNATFCDFISEATNGTN